MQAEKILLTGANGFLGQACVKQLQKQDRLSYRLAVRKATSFLGEEVREVGDISATTSWQSLIQDCKIVIHLAARVHVMKDKASDPLAEFRKTNVEGTLHLARQAAANGVKRFIFISTIKVNGESTSPGAFFQADHETVPEDPYSLSKFEAEQGLKIIARETGMEVVIIRPPLIYGAGVKGNFKTLLQWVHKGFPLPLGGIDNLRSLVSLDNMVDFILTCATHPGAANQTFLVSDGEDISTPQLLQTIGASMNKPTRLIALPQRVLGFLSHYSGALQRLCGSLRIDIRKNEEILDWKPIKSRDNCLQETVAAFLTSL